MFKSFLYSGEDSSNLTFNRESYPSMTILPENESNDEESDTDIMASFLATASPSMSENVAEMLENDVSTTTIASTSKRKGRPNYICTLHCRYDIVRHIASIFGMRESHENWNILWSDYLVSCDKVKKLKKYQKVNHFPGMSEICRKDCLARNLNRMNKVFPMDYDFFPKTWLIPGDFGDVSDFVRKHRHVTFILKPDVGCKGKGISLTKNVKDLVGLERTICQVYVSKPYLIDGFKFDLRVYVLVTSCDPLRLYVYNEGLVRFATKRYSEPSRTNMTNMYMHLTNYSVNKFSRTYIADPEEGSKRKLSTFNDYLRKHCHDVDKLWESIDDVIIKTVFLALPTIQHNYKAAFPNHHNPQACFELLGFDLILDNTLKPYLLEVNHSPSFHTEAPIDREVKEALIIDTFQILNLPKNNKYSVMLEEKRNVTSRLLKDLHGTPNGAPIINTKPDSIADQIKKLELYEKQHLGNFRKIYPNNNMDLYSIFYCQGTSSLFNETFASRARERVSRFLKEVEEGDIKQLNPFEPVVSQAYRKNFPVAEFAKNSKYKDDISVLTTKWEREYKTDISDSLGSSFGDFEIAEQNRTPSEIHWDVEFGLNKNHYKIDSFPSCHNSTK